MLSEVARGRFQKAIDRRFFREKYKFDQAMRKMRLAVGSLVDRETLGRRLLEAAAEVLRVEWGAIYLREPLGRAVSAGGLSRPDARRADAWRPTTRWSCGFGGSPTVRTAARDVAGESGRPGDRRHDRPGRRGRHALEADGELAGLLVLGPKRSGMPFEDEEMAFLGALSSVATLGHPLGGDPGDAGGLNQELRDKVDKIAEQQRRILILQDQLRDRAGREGEIAPLPAERDE